MINSKNVQSLYKFSFLFLFIAMLTSCGQDELQKTPTATQDIEYGKTLADYPSEMTIDNWEQFIYAPDEVLEHFDAKDRENQIISPPDASERIPEASNRSNTFFGLVQSYNGSWTGIGDVTVSREDDPTITATSFAAPGSINYFIAGTDNDSYCMERDLTDIRNGVTTFDLVLISKHILGLDCFTEARQYLGADANRDGLITQADIDDIRSVILHINNNFPSSDNVIFLPKTDYDYLEGLISGCTVSSTFLAADGNYQNCILGFSGPRYLLKTGDVNGSFSF